MDRSPIPLYLFFSDRSQPLEQVRWRLIREAWDQEPSLPGKIGKTVFVALWPFVSALRALQEVLRQGQQVSLFMSKSRLKLFFDMWLAAVWYSLPPKDYCQFADIISQKNSIRLFLYDQERAYIVQALNKDVSREPLLDKFCFYERCLRSNLPCVPVLFQFEQGMVETTIQTDAQLRLNNLHLFAKFCGGSKGDGALAWNCLDDGSFLTCDDKVCSLEDIISDLLSRTQSGARYVLQPRVRNHNSIEDLSLGGLCTARILTAMRLNGNCVVIAAVFRMPGGYSLTDNISTGGVACRINIVDGTLGSGKLRSAPLICQVIHPDTGGKIEGRQLPDWHEALQLCLRAHRVFSEFVFIGWDVAFTNQGPLLVEGNDHPGVNLFQVVAGVPLGSSPFCVVANELLK